MLKLLEQIPVLGKFVIHPVLEGGHILIDGVQGGGNLAIDGVQLVVVRGAVNALQFLLGLGG
jgi:hypothetical protein